MLTGILLLLIFAATLLLVFNYKTNKNSVFLAITFFLLALYGLTHFIVTEEKSVFFGALFYVNFTPLYLTTGPFLYFYVRNTLADKTSFKRKDWIHFLPSLIIFIGIIPYLFTSFEYKMEVVENLYNNQSEVLDFNPNLFFSHIQMFFLRLGSLTIYSLYNIGYILKHKREKYQNIMLSEKQKKTTFNWLISLHLSLLAIVLCYLYFVIQITISPEKLGEALNGVVLNATVFFIGVMIFSLFSFPDIIYGFPNKSHKSLSKNIKTKRPTTAKANSNQKQKNPEDEEEYYNSIKFNIEAYFEKSNAFLKEEFKILDLFNALSVPQHHIRYCLKHFVKKSFPQLKNEYRMKWVAEVLKDPKYNDHTIDAIGEKAGYQSKSAFYTNFKDFYGVTPQEYQNLNKNKN